MGSQLSGSLDIIALGLDQGGDTAPEPPAGLRDEVPGHDRELLPDGDDQRGLDGMRMSISTSLEMATDKIVNRIKIRAARGPHVLVMLLIILLFLMAGRRRPKICPIWILYDL